VTCDILLYYKLFAYDLDFLDMPCAARETLSLVNAGHMKIRDTSLKIK
jgi:hypothetical protein